MKLTSKDVRKYMLWRTDEELVHCPDCIAAACNDAAIEFRHNAKDLMKLLFFNDPIPSLHTHNYTFHTATGRHIIETLKYKYYEYENEK
jgi:hypothetical protein|tara:strand:- start:29 stop:295 length:267 start_codon:yes stop_codon:yes gene_type:complete